MRRTAALIVGGGPAGASAAIVLARAGAPHLLVERSRETGDAICGGFLSWRTLESLARIGIAPGALGPARVVRNRIFLGHRRIDTPLPRPAHGVSRRLLDTVLMQQAIAMGAAVERGVTVRSLVGSTALIDDGAELAGDTLFLASGKHDVRGAARPAEARGEDPVLGLRVRLAAAPGLTRLIGDAIELHLFDRGYVGIVLQEDGSANLCMAVHRSKMLAAGSPAALLDTLGRDHPALGDRLAYRTGGEPIDAIANVPYGWRALQTTDAVFRLGDQAGVIPSLAGEGMGIAIASGIRAGHAYIAGGAAAAPRFQRDFAAATARPIRLAGLVRDAAERPWLGKALLPLVGHVPGLIDIIARATRIGHSPLDHAARQQEN
ncbi:FAD-dependent monooxygenase [Sphingomonas sp. CARO-RG-8B-R24-01]|uniref:NAD(P)/FAD-dependent oxidoreductase n=1 Tax=Sphingomonas sp. CARO-RG-8B-R24-01 TaxID=2914831 RepID=UPI001F572D37|nr:FAD-dependent monooxygenase [Sphingomonas sp. CARO-RG-8B-R24-01]